MEGFNLEEAGKFDWKIKNLIKTEAIINLIMSVLLKSLSFREFLQFLQLLNIREEDMEQLHQSFHHYKVAIRNGLIRVNNKINDSPRTPSQASGATDSMSMRNSAPKMTELLPLEHVLQGQAQEVLGIPQPIKTLTVSRRKIQFSSDGNIFQ